MHNCVQRRCHWHIPWRHPVQGDSSGGDDNHDEKGESRKLQQQQKWKLKKSIGTFRGDTQCKGIPVEVILNQNNALQWWQFYPQIWKTKSFCHNFCIHRLICHKRFLRKDKF